jgi:hypothetical protein
MVLTLPHSPNGHGRGVRDPRAAASRRGGAHRLALLAGLALAELVPSAGARTVRRSRAIVVQGAAAAALALAMYLQYARAIWEPAAYGQPLPPAYPLQEAIRGDSPVLRVLRDAAGPTIELPLWPPQPTIPPYHAVPMYRSIFHWQPLLNGYSSYWPREFPELGRRGAAPRCAPWRAEVPHRLRFVVVRLTPRLWNEERLEPLRQLWRGIAARNDRPDLELMATDDELMLFRVTGQPAP